MQTLETPDISLLYCSSANHRPCLNHVSDVVVRQRGALVNHKQLPQHLSKLQFKITVLLLPPGRMVSCNCQQIVLTPMESVG